VITLLLPTDSRSFFIRRLLAYYEDLKFDGHLLIGDMTAEGPGSDGHKQRNRNLVETYEGEASIDYVDLPGMNRLECLKHLLGVVKTKYVAILNDSDFLVPRGLKQAVEFLEVEPGYSAAHGLITRFNLHSFGAFGEFQQVAQWNQPSLESPTALQRISDFLSTYSGPVPHVQRSADLISMYDNSHQIKDVRFGLELLPGCSSATNGKIKELNTLYLVSQSAGRQMRSPNLFDWITTPYWRPSFVAFRDYISAKIAESGEADLVAAQQTVDQGIYGFLANNSPIPSIITQPKKVSWLRTSGRLAARYVPSIGRAWRMTQPIRQGERYKTTLEGLLQSDSPYHSDFFPIHRVITEPRFSVSAKTKAN